MKVYLASPFFNETEINIYEKVIALLREENGIDLFVPREHTIPNGWDMPNHQWAENVFAVDLLALQKAEVVVVLNHGLYSDSGTAWECGYAYALGKKIVNIIVGKWEEEYSLMMLNGSTYTIPLDTLALWELKDILKATESGVKDFLQK